MRPRSPRAPKGIDREHAGAAVRSADSDNVKQKSLHFITAPRGLYSAQCASISLHYKRARQHTRRLSVLHTLFTHLIPRYPVHRPSNPIHRQTCDSNIPQTAPTRLTDKPLNSPYTLPILSLPPGTPVSTVTPSSCPPRDISVDLLPALRSRTSCEEAAILFPAQRPTRLIKTVVHGPPASAS